MKKVMLLVLIRILLCLFFAIMFSSCSSIPTKVNENNQASIKTPIANATQSGLEPSQTTTSAGVSTSMPIILMSLKVENFQQSIEFTCLNTPHCYPHIVNLTFQNIDPLNSIMDEQGNLYLPLRWPGDSMNEHKNANLLFIDAQSGTQNWISFDEQGSDSIQTPFLHPLLSQQGEITFGDDNGNLFLVKHNLALSRISLPDSQEASLTSPILEINETPAHNLIIPAQTFLRDGKAFGLIFLVNTVTGQVESRLVPLPQFVSPPSPNKLEAGQMYGLNIESVSNDLKTIYISYNTVQSQDKNSLITHIASYDWRTQTKTEGPGFSAVEKYHDIFFRREISDFDYAQIPTAPMLMLRAQNWEPVEALQTIWAGIPKNREGGIRVQIHPFGKNFLVGAKESVYLISTDNGSLKEYTLPDEVKYLSYYLIQYWN